jgi:VIT1/CCC1 family predicted Fe2+/Mn2+ transporter
MSSDSATLRSDVERHIREHVEGERARVERVSRSTAILVAGVAEAVAGSIAMGAGSYLASEAEEAFYQAEIDDERREVLEFPERERAELAVALEREGLPRAEAARVAVGLAANPNVFLRTKVEKELGLSLEAGGAALGDGIVVGLSYILAAIVPLWPYVAFGRVTALMVSVGCTLVALFALGVLKGRVGRQRQVRAGLQVLVIGGVSAAVGFGVRHLVTTLV